MLLFLLIISTFFFFFPNFSLGLIFTGEGIAFIGFAYRHPSIIYNLLAFSIASALGQVSQFSSKKIN